MTVSVAWKRAGIFANSIAPEPKEREVSKGEPDIAILRSSDEAQTVTQRIALL